MKQSENKFYIGTAGWHYPDWKDIVCPHDDSQRKRHKLDLMAEWFNCSEVNTSFYAIPHINSVQKWLDAIENKEDFLLNLKLWQGFTHKKDYEKKDIESFRKAASCLKDKKRLGCVLLQFPWSFKMNMKNISYIEYLIGLFGEYPLAVEIRHDSWNNDEYLNFLKEYKICFCNIDQPQMTHNIPETAHITTDFGYVRFHGRRTDTWFADNDEMSAERYNYIYSGEEMKTWIENMKEMSKHLTKIFVITNNHYRGKAVANAMQIKNKLQGTKFNINKELLIEYPILRPLLLKTVKYFEEPKFL